VFSLLTPHPVLVAELTASDLAVVALMVVVFVLALLLPYPAKRTPPTGRRRR
jgi:hypothetical protein